MNPRFYLGVFASEEHLIAVARATRKAGYRIHDVFTPYHVHGLTDVLGLRPSRLTWVCMAFALAGLVLGAGFQFWVGAVDWPLNVGGKPFNSLPAYLPVTFELTVLSGGLGVALTLFVRSRLYPGKPRWLPHPEVADDRFVLALEVTTPSFEPAPVERLWRPLGLVEARTVRGPPQ